MKTLYQTIAIGTASVLAACAQAPPPRIGVSVSPSVSSAARLAAEDFCDNGPAALFMISPDGSSQTQLAVREAQSFVDDPAVLVVVGHSNSSASIAGARIYQPAGLPQIAPTTTAPLYSQIGVNMFRLVPDDRVQARFLARHLKADSGSLVIAYVNDDYGRALLAEVEKELGGEPAGVVSIAFSDNVDADNVSELAQQIIQGKPGRLLWLGRLYPLSEVAPMLAGPLPGLRIVGSDGIDVPSLTQNLEGAFTGIHFVRLVDSAAKGARIDDVRRRMTGRGIIPSGESLLVYDAVALACDAIDSGARSRNDVREYLGSLGGSRDPFDGVTGPIRFDSKQDVLRDPHMGLVEAGGAITLPPEPAR